MLSKNGRIFHDFLWKKTTHDLTAMRTGIHDDDRNQGNIIRRRAGNSNFQFIDLFQLNQIESIHLRIYLRFQPDWTEVGDGIENSQLCPLIFIQFRFGFSESQPVLVPFPDPLMETLLLRGPIVPCMAMRLLVTSDTTNQYDLYNSTFPQTGSYCIKLNLNLR